MTMSFDQGLLIQTGVHILFKRKWDMKTGRHNVYHSWELSHSNGSSLAVNIFLVSCPEIPSSYLHLFLSWKFFVQFLLQHLEKQQHSPNKFSFILNLARANLCCVLTATRRPLIRTPGKADLSWISIICLISIGILKIFFSLILKLMA